MLTDKPIIALVCSAFLSLGIFGSGYSIGQHILLTKKMNRSVTVKGLAEQEVKSDFGVWKINYKEVGGNLVQLVQRIQHDQEMVRAFLAQQGFTDKEISSTEVKVTDKYANIYAQGPRTPMDSRYVVTDGIDVHSSRVDLIQKVAGLSDQLIQQGVPLAFDNMMGEPNPSYYFQNLDAIRPAMLAAATKSARAIALQFAKDSNHQLGSILHASQGVFQIMSRNTSTLDSNWNNNINTLSAINKKIRLVTTIDYQIK
jgi:uncharacterized protein